MAVLTKWMYCAVGDHTNTSVDFKHRLLCLILSVCTFSNLCCRWFHGKISRDVAEKTLKAVSFNCFLVRASENRIGEFALSLKTHGTVKHFRINTKRSGGKRFELYGAARSFPSLSDLVEYYQQHCITAEGELLTTPCPTEVWTRAIASILFTVTPSSTDIFHQWITVSNFMPSSPHSGWSCSSITT